MRTLNRIADERARYNIVALLCLCFCQYGCNSLCPAN